MLLLVIRILSWYLKSSLLLSHSQQEDALSNFLKYTKTGDVLFYSTYWFQVENGIHEFLNQWTRSIFAARISISVTCIHYFHHCLRISKFRKTSGMIFFHNISTIFLYSTANSAVSALIPTFTNPWFNPRSYMP